MNNLNKKVNHKWNRQNFINKQRLKRKYRFFVRIKNRIILDWLEFKDLFI